MKYSILIIFFMLGIWQISDADPICPSATTMRLPTVINNLQVDNPYADGYHIHETSTFDTPQSWWLRINVDSADAPNSANALQLIKDLINDQSNTIQLTSGPVPNPDGSWWFCYYTLTITATQKTLPIYVYTARNVP